MYTLVELNVPRKANIQPTFATDEVDTARYLVVVNISSNWNFKHHINIRLHQMQSSSLYDISKVQMVQRRTMNEVDVK